MTLQRCRNVCIIIIIIVIIVCIWWQKYSVETWSKYWACSTLFRASSSTLSRQPEVMFQWCHRLMLIRWWRHHSRGSVGHVISSHRPIRWKRGEQSVCDTIWLVWSFDTWVLWRMPDVYRRPLCFARVLSFFTLMPSPTRQLIVMPSKA